MITLDFETEAIAGNPTVNPPKPVGLAIKRPGWPGTYLAWGHPQGNNVTWETAKKILSEIWDSSEPMLFHNAAFDTSVAQRWFGLPEPDPRRVHDTMFSIFLTDPYAGPKHMSLKPSAERILGWPPDEQDDLREWILYNVRPRRPTQWGAHIAESPPHICGPYAVGDVERTWALHEHLFPRIKLNGMLLAYEREQLLRPLLLESERKGLRVNTGLLGRDLDMYERALKACDERVFKKLGCEFDVSKGAQLCDALDKAGLVDEWRLTPTGKRSTAKENIEACVNDADLVALLRYRGALATCLQTFMRPWLELTLEDGRLHPSWNQVRGDAHGGSGARTGRLSGSKPNLMNISNEFEQKIPAGLPPLPLLRKYTVPEPGHVWLKRDFSSQEIRILGHFEDGQLLSAYRKDPNLDPHQFAADLIRDLTGLVLDRKSTKTTAFGIIYGMGLPRLADSLGLDYNEARQVRDAYFAAFPGIADLAVNTKNRGHMNQPIRTWGGRIYYAEPAKLVNGQRRSFEYKLLNYLIQGSAADQTKQSLVDWAEVRPSDSVFLATVHDEINISAPVDNWQEHMACLRECMDMNRMDVPFKSDGFMGENWQEIREVE